MKRHLIIIAAMVMTIMACKPAQAKQNGNDNPTPQNAAETAQNAAATQDEAASQDNAFLDLTTMSDTEGNNRKLSEWVGKGKYVLVDFWASWCGPCRAEMPNVVEAYNRYKDKGFDVVGVSLDQNAQQWKAAIKMLNMPWHHISDLKGWNSEAVQVYGVNAIPANILVDPQGQVIDANLRGEQLLNRLAEIF